ncbi:MAG: AraC family transcriptional regulator [Anaerovorax sp.]|nr:AraC family transcriptional regulator [Anaerovorax sp.]
MEWLKQLSNAIDYIESNLTSDISYEKAAKIACCSTYYFQRMFSYVAGISLSEYIRRRRMTQAAFEIQTGDTRIMDIALKYGYVSPTSFNRAFQSVHGSSPTVARRQGISLEAYPPISFKVVVSGAESMTYRIETKQAFRIVGVQVALEEDMEQNMDIVPKFWEEILKGKQYDKICRLSDQEPKKILGVSAYVNPKYISYYIATETDKPVPEGMVEFEIPAATWAIFECNGHFKESVQTIFKRFLTEWLPFSGYKYAELPDIEVYLVNDQQSKDGHAEVWIAIKKENEEE